MEHNIVITDLKPENTLYDVDLRKTTIIDIGGYLKLKDDSEMQKFLIWDYPPFYKTDQWLPPEFLNEIIKLKKRIPLDVKAWLGFTCG